jgi:hypothetical protein
LSDDELEINVYNVFTENLFTVKVFGEIVDIAESALLYESHITVIESDGSHVKTYGWTRFKHIHTRGLSYLVALIVFIRGARSTLPKVFLLSFLCPLVPS